MLTIGKGGALLKCFPTVCRRSDARRHPAMRSGWQLDGQNRRVAGRLFFLIAKPMFVVVLKDILQDAPETPDLTGLFRQRAVVDGPLW